VEKIDDIGMKGFVRFIFLQNIKPSSFGELKNCIGGGFWGFGRVYMNSSNLIYVVIIFLKLKIY